jgi:ATP diphosphatase
MERHWQAAKAAEKALPPALHLPRAPLAALRFPVADVAAQRAFWNEVAPLLGWSAAHGAPDEAVYGDGAHRLVFSAASPGASAPSATLTFEAPSAAAVERLRTRLESLRPGCVLEAPPGQVAFRDPAGLRWEYVFASRVS